MHIMSFIRKYIPRFLLLWYHWWLALLAAVWYGFPSHGMKVIGVTGTKGKSTTCFMIARMFEEQGYAVAMIGSLGYKIRTREWPNIYKMTMPGRFRLQKFLSQARKSGVRYLVLEVTSEGIAQHRLNGIRVDCAVFTNLHKEHIESHGSFEAYKDKKLELFRRAKNIHVINTDDKYGDEFWAVPAKSKISYGMQKGEITQQFAGMVLKLAGQFNIYNALAAIGVAHAYGLDIGKAKETLEAIAVVPGRMEYIERGQPFEVVIDYAHTPESLEGAYQTLKPSNGKLICVLGAAGGGRDIWKRPVFGEIAERYCDEVILTNEDPYDEDPEKILEDIACGKHFKKILDREKAIETAIHDAQGGDTVIITGKGSETSMAIGGGKTIPWSDRDVVVSKL